MKCQSPVGNVVSVGSAQWIGHHKGKDDMLQCPPSFLGDTILHRSKYTDISEESAMKTHLKRRKGPISDQYMYAIAYSSSSL
nr:hypothetical protein HmN_000889400 [Hymenolepis microstoma]